ncbi:class I SAM-dependent methyltransferase [Kitasatospora acidiphila]|uniref:class I SAM-dependent methyltransferase n=1 Tax=Kitasatospora acidiphila TaxID=2567942 RepID=UPI001E5023BB|nr:class I SAM-dependent methyltransferase [Kitasatospora acidiphila]
MAALPRTPADVLDLGCGDAEMTLRLTSAGHRVTGVDPSAGMLASAAERLGTRPETADRVRLLQTAIATLPTDLGVFDAVMYLDDSAEAISRLAGLVAPGDVLSVLTKYRQAIGVREALRGEYQQARELIEAGTDVSIGNLGLRTRGDDAAQLDAWAKASGRYRCRGKGCASSTTTGTTGSRARPSTRKPSNWSGAASTRHPYRETARLIHTLGKRVGGNPSRV